MLYLHPWSRNVVYIGKYYRYDMENIVRHNAYVDIIIGPYMKFLPVPDDQML